MLDGSKSECEARVVLSHERHLHKAEVTVEYHDHSMVALADDSDLFTAIHGAIVKLEKQAIKVRAKWRDSKRVPRKQIERAFDLKRQLRNIDKIFARVFAESDRAQKKKAR